MFLRNITDGIIKGILVFIMVAGIFIMKKWNVLRYVQHTQ